LFKGATQAAFAGIGEGIKALKIADKLPSKQIDNKIFKGLDSTYKNRMELLRGFWEDYGISGFPGCEPVQMGLVVEFGKKFTNFLKPKKYIKDGIKGALKCQIEF